MALHTIGLTTQLKATACAALLLTGLAACHAIQDTDSLLVEARQYRQRGETRAAIIQLKNALQKDPNNAQVRALLGDVYIDAGDALSAEKELRKAQALGIAPVQIYPSLGKAMLMLGQAEKVLAEIKPEPVSPDQMAIVALRANAHLAMGNMAQAKESFDLILKKRPDFADALLGLAKIAVASKQIAKAAALIEQALGANPGDIDSLRLKGDILRMQGKNDAARLAYGQILKLRPDNAHAHIDIASVHIQAGKFSEAKAEIDAARRAAPNSLMVFHAQALLDFREGKNKSALEALQQVLRAAPDHMPSILLMSAVQLALGSPQQAELFLRRFLEANPKHVYANKMLASIAIGKGESDAVINLVAPLLQTNPDDVELLALVGEAHMHARRFSKAADYFQKASDLSPQAAPLRAALGMSRLGMGENARAIVELERATVLDAKSSRAGIMLVMTHLRTREYDQALAAVNLMERQQASNALIHNLKGVVLLAKKDLVAARTSFDKAVSLDPANLPAMENLAQLDLAEKKPEQARQRFEAALATDKKNAGLMTALAKLATARGNNAEALRWLERASKENPDALPPAILLSNFYVRVGEKQKALVLAQKLQASNPGNAETLALLAQVEYETGNPAAALDSYTKLAVLQPRLAALQLRISGLQMTLNDRAGALQSVKKALSLQPGLIEAQVAEVALLLANGSFGSVAEALAVARTVQKQRADLPAGFKLEGDVLMAQNKALPALKLYEQAFGLSKTGPLFIKVHQTLVLAGKTTEADARITSWLKEHPADLSIRLYLAGTRLARKQYKLAMEQYEYILQQDPKNIVALNDLAWVYQQEKDPRALAMAERAHEIQASPAVADTLAWILVEKGDTDRAIALLRKAVAMAPSATEIRYHLGVGLAKSGDKQGARTQFEQLLASGKDFPNRSEVKALLGQLQAAALPPPG